MLGIVIFEFTIASCQKTAPMLSPCGKIFNFQIQIPSAPPNHFLTTRPDLAPPPLSFPSTRSVRSSGGLHLSLARDWVFVSDYTKTSKPSPGRAGFSNYDRLVN